MIKFTKNLKNNHPEVYLKSGYQNKFPFDELALIV